MGKSEFLLIHYRDLAMSKSISLLNLHPRVHWLQKLHIIAIFLRIYVVKKSNAFKAKNTGTKLLFI